MKWGNLLIVILFFLVNKSSAQFIRDRGISPPIKYDTVQTIVLILDTTITLSDGVKVYDDHVRYRWAYEIRAWHDGKYKVIDPGFYGKDAFPDFYTIEKYLDDRKRPFEKNLVVRPLYH